MSLAKKKHTLNIQGGGKSSRFMVDLAASFKREEEIILKRIEKERNKFSFKKLLPKFSFKKFLIGSKNILPNFSNYYYFFFHKKYKKLSFYFLFNSLCKISYATGWLFVFGIRFFFLTFIFAYKKTHDRIALWTRIRREARIVREEYLQTVQPVIRSAAPAKKIKASFKFKFRNIIPNLRFSLARQVAAFAILLLVLILPLKAYLHYRDFLKFKGEVLGVSASAVDDMKNSSGDISNLNFDEATKNFNKAADNFRTAQNDIKEVNAVFGALAKVVPNKNIKLAAQADLFLRAGELTASIANRIGGSLDLFEAHDLKIKDVLNIVYENLNSSNAEIVELGEILRKIDLNNLPDEYREKVSMFQESSVDISNLFNEVTRLIDGTRQILGFDQDRRYLIVFQNNTEMRGSGGFIGSYALADFHNGEMTNLEVPKGGSYDTEAGYLERVAAPEPLQLVNPLWHFWDANWWPDWALSAKKLMWFYEKSNGPTVDGVIAITPNVMDDLLKIIGPLDLTEKYGVVITSDNFWEVVQDIVEKKPEMVTTTAATSSLLKVVEQKHEPKKIIGDMMNLIMTKASKELNREDFLLILNSAYRNLNEKQILTYFVDEDLEKLVSDFDWAGLVENIDGDYLMVANSNIAGFKTDKKIKENIALLKEVQADGSIINTLTIQRRHTAIRGEEHVGVRNVNWMRVYVPEGSELISASGFSQPDGAFFEKPMETWKKDEDVMRGEGTFSMDGVSGTKIYKELGKTVFANWSMIDPGEQALVVIKYRLPFKAQKIEPIKPKTFWEKIINGDDDTSYVPLKLLVQKQPGSQGSEFVSNLTLPSDMQVAWQNNESLNYRNKLNVDRNWVVLLSIGK